MELALTTKRLRWNKFSVCSFVQLNYICCKVKIILHWLYLYIFLNCFDLLLSVFLSYSPTIPFIMIQNKCQHEINLLMQRCKINIGMNPTIIMGCSDWTELFTYQIYSSFIQREKVWQMGTTAERIEIHRKGWIIPSSWPAVIPGRHWIV